MSADSPELVTVANCWNLQQALEWKTRLESAGIPVFLPDETTAAIAPHHFLTGVRLQVSSERAEEAKTFLRDLQGESGGEGGG